jgi:drug/metabolite transporter (DMT)-like permease
VFAPASIESHRILRERRRAEEGHHRNFLLSCTLLLTVTVFKRPENSLPFRSRKFSPIDLFMSVSTTSPSAASVGNRLWLADLSLLAVAIIWGVNIPVMKVALELGITPYALNAFRLVISAIVLLGCAWWEYRSGVRPYGTIQKWRVIVYAMIVSVAYQYLFLMAVSKTTSANIALIMATVPMWTALGARCFLKEILPPLAWVGLFIAFAGTMIVTVQRSAPSTGTSKAVASADLAEGAEVAEVERDLPSTQTGAVASDARVARPASLVLGNLIALVASLTWAGGTVFSRPLLRTISPLQLAACSATIGLPFHILFAWTSLGVCLPLLKQVPLLMCILYSGILSTGLALAMWSYGVKHAGAAQATMFQNLSPLIAIGTAWAWRGESVTWPQTFGGIMIIGGLIVMRKSRRIP